MHRSIIAGMLALVLHVPPVRGNAPESPAPGELLPGPDCVIKNDIFKLSVPRIFQSDTVSRVVFRVRYAHFITNKQPHVDTTRIIATDSVPPFETIWDCSDVPDQDRTNLQFMYHIYDSHADLIQFPVSNPAQEGSTVTDCYYLDATLDRNPHPPGMIWKAAHAGRNGKAADRDGTIRFTCNDNHVTARARWDDRELRITARVADRHQYPDAAQDSVPAYMMDGIELFLDPECRRLSFRDARTYQVIAPVTGGLMTYTPFSDADYAAERTGPVYHPLVQVARHDTGYTIDISLSWNELGVVPAPGKKLGINLVNSDLDHDGGVVMTASWAGISDLVHHNPSEWGTLVLQPGRLDLPLLPFIIGLALLSAGTLAYAWRKKRLSPSGRAPKGQHRVMQMAETYVREHLGDEKLALQQVADHVSLSPDYLRQLCKKTTGQNFTDFMNALRVERACDLLGSSDKQITEVGFMAGFGTYQSFNRVFKDATGCTPKEYRERSRRHTAD